MDFTEILAIAGKPGLYKMVAQTGNGVIVESLIDGKRFTAFAHERVSSLNEISIYTEDDDLALIDVFKMISEKEEGKKAIDAKSDKNALRTYFKEVVPDHDEERVYVSDIKKVISWYNLLVEKDMLDILDVEEESKEEEEEKVDEKQEDNKD